MLLNYLITFSHKYINYRQVRKFLMEWTPLGHPPFHEQPVYSRTINIENKLKLKLAPTIPTELNLYVVMKT